jgi:hypothetical protein
MSHPRPLGCGRSDVPGSFDHRKSDARWIDDGLMKFDPAAKNENFACRFLAVRPEGANHQ